MPVTTVFVSRPTALTADQQVLYGRWTDGLTGLGFGYVTVSRDSYTASPWVRLRDALDAADGALILGFRQLLVERGVRRPGTPEQTAVAGSYATPWNQVEAGLAAMAGLPVLVVPEDDVSDGVFAEDVWLDGVYGAHMGLWTAGGGARDPSLRAWAAAVQRRAERSMQRKA